MGLSSSRVFYLALTFCLVVLAFLPHASANRWLDLALAPARVLGELASPIGLLARGEARAAEQQLAAAVPREHEESRQLARDERMFALPDEDALFASRRFLHAQVVRRFQDAPDRVECALEESADAELVPGLPVVLSNSYVGRVAAVDAARGRILVHLVTDKDFRIGASCPASEPAEPAVAMVVGGIEAAQGTPLSLHNPERAGLLSGLVRVDDRLNPRAPFPELAQGFRLGVLAACGPRRTAIFPEIDFANGLFRVVVVLPPRAEYESSAVDADVFADVNWRPARAYSACEPAPWREGVKIDCPFSGGARPGSAVVAGPRLVGFVVRAGALESDVALLGDSGVRVPAQACVDGELAPLVLGHLVALGRASPGGPARFLWSPAQPLRRGADGAAVRHAHLFTGAGELGVPRGLVIGDTLLPCGSGPHVIEVAQGFDARLLRTLWVWRAIEREEQSGAP